MRLRRNIQEKMLENFAVAEEKAQPYFYGYVADNPEGRGWIPKNHVKKEEIVVLKLNLKNTYMKKFITSQC